MTRVTLTGAISAGVVLAATASAAPPSRVLHRDYRIGTFAVRKDGSFGGVIRAFGQPASLRRTSAGCRGIWSIGLRVDFYNLGGGDPCKPSTGRFGHASTTGRGWRTAKGLRVGNTLGRARELFPGSRLHGSQLRLIVHSWPIGTIVRLSARMAEGRVAGFEVSYPAGGE